MVHKTIGSAVPPQPTADVVLQRACACDNHAPGGKCETCKRERLQRQTAVAPAPNTVPPIVHEVLHAPGQPLDHTTRAFMEPRFGHDFGDVRVHTDPHAAESACAVNALAYTVGNHIAFGTGQYQPHSGAGRRLLAHELAHTVQQENANRKAPTQFEMVVGADSSTAEFEAHQVAHDVMMQQTIDTWAVVDPDVLQRQATPNTTTYTIKLEMPPSPAEQRQNLPREEALKVLRIFLRRVGGYIEAGEYGHDDLINARKEQRIVGAVSSFFGGRTIPPREIWNQPRKSLAVAQQAVDEGLIDEATRWLQTSAKEARDCHLQVIEYREGSISGAERAEFALEVVQVAAAATVTIGTGGTAGVFVGAGYGALQNVARQGSELYLGLRDRIDWAGITFDALFGLVTGYLGGKLGNYAFARLLKQPEVAALGQKVLAHTVSDLISGRISSILQTAGRTVFDSWRGQSDITVEQFMQLLLDQLFDPKGAFLDIILGHAQRIAATRMDISRVQGASSEPPSSQQRGSLDIPAEELLVLESPIETQQRLTEEFHGVRQTAEKLPSASIELPIERFEHVGDVKIRKPKGFETGRAKRGQNVAPGTLEDLEPTAFESAPTKRQREVTPEEQRAGIPLDWEQRIRSKTPSDDIRAALQAELPVGAPDPAFPGQVVTGPSQADHIVSVDRIRRMPGFADLDETRQFQVLNFTENFVALSPPANMSKGAKSFSEWTHHKGLGQPVDPSFLQKMIAREKKLEPVLQQMIDSLLKQQMHEQRTQRMKQ